MDPEDRPPATDDAVESTNGACDTDTDTDTIDDTDTDTDTIDDTEDPEAFVGDPDGGDRDGPVADVNPDRSEDGLLKRFRRDNEGPLMWLREMLSSVAIVLLLGLILFGVSGVWPPMVAVESGSMEPNMEVGDLVFVTEPGRFAPDAADNDIGVVTYENGQAADYRTFGTYGSVVIYQPPGRTASPIIHRAMFHVDEGENWYERADRRLHNADDCEELRNCPAPHDGFITLGDNNGQYDQANGLSEPVKADWVTGVARLRVPYLGYVRLIATGQAKPSDLISVSTGVEPRELGTESTSPLIDRSESTPGTMIGTERTGFSLRFDSSTVAVHG
ncbi:S26 family signal peptidase [Halorubrum sp. DTA98]|uniref:S26 family signal peptidase n=1 Tax=Halorubrum sp. DTA98 TaxID=3402163 RepID=UPI003AAA9E29